MQSKEFKVGKAKYKIYSDGRVHSFHTGKVLRGYFDKNGYLCYHIGKAHRLVLTHFERAPKAGEVCRHLDGNPKNNNLTNLKWGTIEENWQDSKDHNTAKLREKHGRAKLTWKDVDSIRQSLANVPQGKQFQHEKQLAEKYKVSQSLINKIKLKQIWQK